MAYTAKDNAWEESQTKAKVAEEIAMQILHADGWDHVLDKRDDYIFQKMDVDFLTLSRKRVSQFVEVKSDDCAKNNNYCLEVVSNTDTGTPGWGLTTKADQIWIYRSAFGTIDLLDGPKTVAWLKANHDRQKNGRDEFFALRNGTKKKYGNGTLYPSLCRLVNRDLFAKEVGIIRRINVRDYLTQAS